MRHRTPHLANPVRQSPRLGPGNDASPRIGCVVVTPTYQRSAPCNSTLSRIIATLKSRSNHSRSAAPSSAQQLLTSSSRALRRKIECQTKPARQIDRENSAAEFDGLEAKYAFSREHHHDVAVRYVEFAACQPKALADQLSKKILGERQRELAAISIAKPDEAQVSILIQGRAGDGSDRNGVDAHAEAPLEVAATAILHGGDSGAMRPAPAWAVAALALALTLIAAIGLSL
jgi:hypothetical protein